MAKNKKNFCTTHEVIKKWEKEKLGDKYSKVLWSALYHEDSGMRHCCWALIVLATGVTPYTVALSRTRAGTVTTEEEVISLIEDYQQGYLLI